MKQSSRLLIPLVLIAFLILLVLIVLAPVETGDAYPKYSSLRADPLGTKILFDSLAAMPGLRVERNFKPQQSLAHRPDPTILHLGMAGPGWYASEDAQLKPWETLASGGARVVFVFAPSLPALDANFDVFKKPKAKEEKPYIPAVQTKWGVQMKLRKAKPAERAKMERTPRYSALYFEPDASWSVMERDDQDFASYIEKPMGKGTVVLVAQSYALSNEGIREEADAQWISALIGPNKYIIFDESHLGIAETGSVGTMVRRYRLQGAVAILLLLGLLFIWRNATSLLPAREDSASAVLAGRDAQQGMATLLQRSIPREQLLPVCLEEWTRSLTLRSGVSKERLDAVRQVPLDSPVEAYNRIHQILTEQK